jgi:HK97 family phage major capsid protein
MTEEIKGLLDELQANIEGKSKEQLNEEIKNLEVKYEEMIESKASELSKSVEEIKAENSELKSNLEAIQAHADKLDVKMQENVKQSQRVGDPLKSIINENYDEIKSVGKGKAIELKVVGDMTLGTNLTGDQPRDYSFDVAMTPGQLVNVADLVGSVAISGGTYTFPRETGSEGAIGAQTEGSAKSQIDYDLSMIDVNTDFIAGFCVYSRKMKNNLPFLESFLPQALRRDYWIAENTAFDAVLAAGVTASTELITGQNKIEMLIAEIAKLEGANYQTNAIVVTPADFYDILITEKSTGAGYGLPGVVTFSGGALMINGIPVLKANWVDANKYYVGDWSRVKKVTTEGLGLEFSEDDSDNFRKNNITARIEAQVALAIEQPAALVYGDFTAV